MSISSFKNLQNFKQLETSQAKQKQKEQKKASDHKISYQERKELDKKIVLNSIKLKWNLIVEEFAKLTKNLKFD